LRRVIVFLTLAAAVLAAGYVTLKPSRSIQGDKALNEIAGVVDSVRRESYPQLKDAGITLKEMQSDYVYFETRFTFTSYFLGRKLNYMISVNPEVLARQVPPDGLRAIVAHELAHVDYFHNQSRMGLLGLVRLVSAPYNSRFERGADLETIALGYGPGLQSFRTWLYRNIPLNRMEEKKRDYFSPSEIQAILSAVQGNPQLIQTFVRCVPMDLAEIEREIQSPEGACSK
jgi:hypothetical protein